MILSCQDEFLIKLLTDTKNSNSLVNSNSLKLGPKVLKPLDFNLLPSNLQLPSDRFFLIQESEKIIRLLKNI